MRVFIAEKPSLARAIAAVLPGPHKEYPGYIQASTGEIVTWCIGHLLEQVAPDAYDHRYKRWNMHDLPIIPNPWKLAPRKSSAKQLSVLRTILKRATSLVHAGDPDREGQLLVDEVIHHLEFAARKRPIERLLLRDLNPAAVKRSLAKMQNNRDFAPLSVSALARSRADWLYGMNMSRAYTLLGQKAGYRGVLSVGRVQTPILGLVVRRDAEIENFVAVPYYLVDAHIQHKNGTIIARWQPSTACLPFQDESGRVLRRDLAENVVTRISGQPATLTKCAQQSSKLAPPLPYSLSALQIDAAKRFSMSAASVLSTCQTLYEKHKLITYPRSDCRYLPEEHFEQAPVICAAIGHNSQALKSAEKGVDIRLRSKTWNDKKVSAHHAIIPTAKKITQSNLNRREQDIYALIARQYLMQFYGPALSMKSSLEFVIAGGEFVAKAQSLTDPGWRALLPPPKRADNSVQSLPTLKKGTELRCIKGVLLDKRTEAPKPFTDASLLQATTGIARYVQDSALRKVLRDTDGIGTEATRAGIFETLFKRKLLAREAKSIHATAIGKGLITALPPDASYPDMTARWEQKLSQIAQGNYGYESFMEALETHVRALVSEVQTMATPSCLKGLGGSENA